MREISVIYGVLPLSGMIGPPITGLIADKMGRYTATLSLVILLTAALHSCLLAIPTTESNTLLLSCDRFGHSLHWDNCTSACSLPEENMKWHIQTCRLACVDESEAAFCFSSHDNNICFNATNKFSLQIFASPSSLDVDSCNYSLNNITSNGTIIQFDNLTCPKCDLECEVLGGPDCALIYVEFSIIFAIYFIVRLMANTFLTSAFSMVDTVVLKVTSDNKGSYGKQVVMNLCAQAVAPLFAALIVTSYNIGKVSGRTDYSPVFYLGDALLIISAFIFFRMQVKIKAPAQNILADLRELLGNPEILIFIVVLACMGSNWGFLENYLFIYLTELNAPTYLLGLTITVGCLVGIPALVWSDYLIKKIGRNEIFLICFMAYFIRLFGYSYLTSPWYCFPYEMLEMFTYSLMWVAAATYCRMLAPKTLLATMTAIAGTAHFSTGRGLGAFIGGQLIAHYGTAMGFRILGVFSLIIGFCYLPVYYFYLRKKLLEKEKESKTLDEESQRMMDDALNVKIVKKEEGL